MIARLTALLPDAERGRFRRYLALVVAGTLLRAATCVTLVPIIRELFGDRPADAWPWVGVLTLVTAAGWFVDLRAARNGIAIGRVLMETMHERLVDRLAAVSIGWLDADRTNLAQRTLAGVGQSLYSGMTNLVLPILTATLTPYAIGLLLLAVSWPVGLVALACAPLLQLAHRASDRLVRAADREAAAAGAEVDLRVVEFARLQPVLRAFGRAEAEGSALGEAVDAQHRSGVRLLGRSIPGQVLFAIASQLALLLLGATAVARWSAGDLSVPETIAIFVVIVRYLEPFTELADLAGATEAMASTMDRTALLLDAPVPPVAATPTRLDAAPGRAPSVELRDVTFAPGGTPVLDGASLTIPAGSVTAVVGPSGAGKTTILSLVARFVDPDGGAVLLDGVDVRDLDPASHLGALAVVFQDVYLFEGTLRENVVRGNPDATDDAIEAAAAIARVDEIVARLPDGWDTRVGEGGTTLSGGERQRISIARAVLKDAPLLLLDEATSAIDAENEVAVLDALAAAGADGSADGDGTTARRTVVIVAHRERTVAHADHVVFVEAGRVVESGTPQELLDAGGRFAGWWRDREAGTTWRLAPTP